MGEFPTDGRTDLSTGAVTKTKGGQSIVSSMAAIQRSNKKKLLGGPMNQEEIKMNRGLLKEISQLKKQMGERYTSPLSNNNSKRGNLELHDLEYLP